jgi:hypothetical protein
MAAIISPSSESQLKDFELNNELKPIRMQLRYLIFQIHTSPKQIDILFFFLGKSTLPRPIVSVVFTLRCVLNRTVKNP